MTDAPFTFTDENGELRTIVARRADPLHWHDATISDLTRALAEKDLVILPRGSNEAVFQQLCEQLTTRVGELEAALKLARHVAAGSADNAKQLMRERDEALRAVEDDARRYVELDQAYTLVTGERDEARAELERTRRDLATEKSRGDDHLAAFAKKDQILRERNAQLQELRAELEKVKALREDRILTALSRSCNELSAALADRQDTIEKLRKARRQRNEAVAEAAVLRNERNRLRSQLSAQSAVVEAAKSFRSSGGTQGWFPLKRALDALASAGSEPKRAGVESESGVRVPGCKCHWEEGDSPCPVHGEDEEPATEDPAPKQGEATSDWGPGREGELRRKLGAARGLLYAYPDITQDEVTSILEETADLHPSNAPAAVPAERVEALESLLRRIVKYAREDRMRTPGTTRLARALAEAQKLLETAKPDAGGGG